MKKLLCLASVLSLLAIGTLFVWGGKSAARYQGRPIGSWVEDLASGDYQVRAQAAEAMRAIGSKATPFLLRALRDPESLLERVIPGSGRWLPFGLLRSSANAALLRERAAAQLGRIGSRDRSVIRALISALGDNDRDVRAEVQRALRWTGAESVPDLVWALHRRNAQIREGVAQVLMDFGPEARSALPALVLTLQDGDALVRCRTAQALGAIPCEASQVIGPLTGALADNTAMVRKAAAESLGKFGRNAVSAVPALTKTLVDPDSGVRVCAAKALWQIERRAEPIVPVLIEALKDPLVGWQACFVLGEIGPNAEAAVPALIEAMKVERVPRPLRSPPSCVFALGQIGAAAVPRLMATLCDERAPVRTAAAMALGFIGPGAKAAVGRLVALLKDKDLEVRQASALSLSVIEPQNQELTGALAELTHDDDIFISSAAAGALRKARLAGDSGQRGSLR